MAQVQIWQVSSLKRMEIRSRNTLSISDEMNGRFPFGAYHKAFEGDVPEVAEVEGAFFHFNRGSGGYLDQLEVKQGKPVEMYSLSVGDIVIIDGKGLRCASCGWDDVTAALLGNVV